MNAPGIGAARFVGQRVARKEDARLLTGRGQFVDDVVLPGMLHVAFVRSPIARGRIRSIDPSMAREMPGVHALLLSEDLAKFGVTLLSFYFSSPEIAIPLLAAGRVAHVGDPVALVVAQSRYLAEDAAALVTVEYDEEPAVVTLADAKTGPRVHPDADSNVAAAMGEEDDEELEAILAAAPHLVTHEVFHQRLAQSPMETRGVVASAEGAEELTVHISCQSPHLVARYISQAFGLPQMSIRVLARDVGGSFGLKVQPWREELAVIAAALLLRRPLKWIEDRLENLTAANQAREQQMTLRAAFDAEGRLVASHSDYDMNNGAYPHGADCNIAVQMFVWAAYKMPRFGFHTKGWFTNTAGLSAYRGPWGMESLARETLLDKAARQIGIDPIEIRRRNLVRLSDQPCATPLGVQLDDITPAECLDKLLETLDVAAFRKEQAAARAQGRYLGLGIATYIEPTAATGSIAVMTGETAQIRIEPTGKVTAMLSTHSQGHGTQTTMAQVIADQLGVTYEDVAVFEGDSARGAFGPGASGSRQGVAGGGASMKAAALLADKVRRLAAHLLNAQPDDVRIEAGMIHVAGAEEMSRSLRQIAEIAYGEPDRLPPGMEAGLEAQYRYTPPPVTFTSAAHACIVEVDAETGFVTILRWISSEDCGNIINPAVVEGQIAGGLAQAIGAVLLEEIGYDARGNPTAVTYKDYLLPAIGDVPDFEYVHACTPSQTEGGFRGVGEGGAIIGPPTLVNAIADALAPFGEVPVTLPLSPARLLEVIEGRPIANHTEVRAPDPEVVQAPFDGMPPAGDVQLPGADSARDNEAAAAETVDGRWKMVLSTPVGPQEFTAHFVTDGGVLTGTLYSAMDPQDFTGTVSGGNIKFDLKVTKPLALTLKYDVQIDGDKLTGKVKMGFFGTAKLVGTRL